MMISILKLVSYILMLAVSENLVDSQWSLVLPHAQQQPHLEVILAAGPSVEAGHQLLPGFLPKQTGLTSANFL